MTGMTNRVAYFRQKANKCQRLADILRNQADPVALTLRSMAAEFDAKVNALETQVVTEAAHVLRGKEAPSLH